MNINIYNLILSFELFFHIFESTLKLGLIKKELPEKDIIFSETIFNIIQILIGIVGICFTLIFEIVLKINIVNNIYEVIVFILLFLTSVHRFYEFKTHKSFIHDTLKYVSANKIIRYSLKTGIETFFIGMGLSLLNKDIIFDMMGIVFLCIISSSIGVYYASKHKGKDISFLDALSSILLLITSIKILFFH